MNLHHPISDPRSPLTPVPAWRWTGNLKSYHESMYPKRLDRGAQVPVNGIRQMMPGLRPGGVPHRPPPLAFGVHLIPISQVSPGLAMRQRAAINQETYHLIGLRRPTVLLKEGLSAMDIARVPRNLWRGWVGKSPKPRQRGLMALHMQIPSDKLQHFAARRFALEYRRPEGPIAFRVRKRIVPTPQDVALIAREPQGARLGTVGRFKPKAMIGGGMQGAVATVVRRRFAGPSPTAPQGNPMMDVVKRRFAQPAPIGAGGGAGGGVGILDVIRQRFASPAPAGAFGGVTNVIGQRLATPTPPRPLFTAIKDRWGG